MFYKRGADEDEKLLLEPLINGKSGIDLGEMDFLRPYVKSRINVAGRCGKSCSLNRSCRYMSFLKNAQSDKHDFQICNQNYMLADVLRRSKGQSSLIPHYQAIVIDEAHKFIQAARQIYGTLFSSQTLPRIAKTIRSFVFQPGESTAELWRDTDKLDGQAKRLFRVLVENIPGTALEDEAERFKTEIEDKATRSLRNLSDILERLIAELEKRRVLQKYAGL